MSSRDLVLKLLDELPADADDVTSVDISRAPTLRKVLEEADPGSLGIVSRAPPGSRAPDVYIPPRDAMAAGFPRTKLGLEHPDRDLAAMKQWVLDWRAGKAEPPRVEV